MGRSFWYDLGTGIVTSIISTVVVAIVWKCIQAMLNISRGQPKNQVEGIQQSAIDMTSSGPPTSISMGKPVAGGQCVIDITSSGPPTSISMGQPQNPVTGGQSVIGMTSSGPPTSLSMGQPENPVAGGQSVIDITSSGPPTSSPGPQRSRPLPRKRSQQGQPLA